MFSEDNDKSQVEPFYGTQCIITNHCYQEQKFHTNHIITTTLRCLYENSNNTQK